MTRVLLVDDDEELAAMLREYLEQEGFEVDVAHDGESGAREALTGRYAIAVLDVMMPRLNGVEALRRIRAESRLPVLMLTAKGDDIDRIIGLELGADDYMTKPFSPKELVARVRVVFRRIENAADAGMEVIRAADLTLDIPRLRVTASGRGLEELTPTEFELLAALARQPGRVFTRAQLLDAIHGVAFESYERAIDAHIKNIRKKIEPVPPEPRYVLTVYGVGYKFADK